MRIHKPIKAAGLAAAATALLVPIAATATELANAKPLSDEQLAGHAGREDIQQSSVSDQDATVAGNSVSGDSQTGTVEISDNAFQHMNGMSILNANTGNNVAINATIQVNIAMPAGDAATGGQ